jgi:hypothetical protein
MQLALALDVASQVHHPPPAREKRDAIASSWHSHLTPPVWQLPAIGES